MSGFEQVSQDGAYGCARSAELHHKTAATLGLCTACARIRSMSTVVVPDDHRTERCLLPRDSVRRAEQLAAGRDLPPSRGTTGRRQRRGDIERRLDRRDRRQLQLVPAVRHRSGAGSTGAFGASSPHAPPSQCIVRYCLFRRRDVRRHITANRRPATPTPGRTNSATPLGPRADRNAAADERQHELSDPRFSR